MKTVIFKACLAILLLATLTSDGNSQLRNQIFIGARPLGLGETFVAIADDGNASYWNPAGLPLLKGLAFNSMYANLYNIQGLRTIYLSQAFPFKERWALGVSWFNFGFSDKEDDEFEYSQNKFHASLGYRIYKNLSVGLNAKYLNRSAKLDGLSMGKADGFGFDFGAIYSLPLSKIKFLKSINLGMMIHDIAGTRVTYSKTDNSEKVLDQSIRFGFALNFKERISLKWFSLRDALLAFDFDDRFHVGTEAWLLDILGIRAGLQKDFHTSESMTYSFGVSIRYKNLQLDHAYVLPPSLPSSNIFSLSFDQDVSPVSITDVRVNEANDLFVSFYKSYKTSDMIKVAIRNDYDQSLDGKISISFPGLPADSTVKDFSLDPNEIRNYQVPANFSDEILDMKDIEQRNVEVSLDYKLENKKKSTKTINKFRLIGRGAMTWGEPGKYAAFITKNDNMVKYFSSNVTNHLPYRAKDEFRNLFTAAALFESLHDINISYQENDEKPFLKIPFDREDIYYVKYPAELFISKQGDCDDITVLYASLLECSGINTALVSASNYLTLMFDTGIQETNKSYLPFGDSLYVIKNRSIWIPVDVKEIGKSFEDSWYTGCKKYHESESDDDFQDINFSDLQDIYPSALPPELQNEIPDLPKAENIEQIAENMEWINKERIDNEKDQLSSELKIKPKNSSLLNRLGIALVKQDSLTKATAQLDSIFKYEPRNPQALVNMGNIHFLSGRLKAAEECYLQAERHASEKSGLYLNLAILFQHLKVESPSDSIPSQGESEKYLLNALNLLDGNKDRVLDLLQIAIEEMDETEIEQLKSDTKKLVMATKLFLKFGAEQYRKDATVKGAGMNTKFLKKGPDKNRRYILWWAS